MEFDDNNNVNHKQSDGDNGEPRVVTLSSNESLSHLKKLKKLASEQFLFHGGSIVTFG